MLLFNRLVVTTGDMEALMPLVQNLAAIIQKEAGTTVHVWAGGNGFVTGSLGFSIAYETLAARSAVTAKLGASKPWWAANRQFREHVVSMEPIPSTDTYRVARWAQIFPWAPPCSKTSSNSLKAPTGWPH